MNDAELFIKARDIQSGEQWTFQDAGLSGCVTTQQVWEGDGPVAWTAPFTAFETRMLPRHAAIEVHDADGLVQSGRIVRRAPPGTDQCQGTISYTAEGGPAYLGDRHLAASTFFGPVWTGSSLAQTPEATVIYGITQLGGSITYDPTGIGVTDFPLSDTEDYQGRTALDIINAMTAISAGLSTPFAPSVRNGVFRWMPIDLSPRYEVLCGNGAVVTPVDDASHIYTRVIVIYGNRQAVAYPPTVDYTHLPTIVDLVVNATYEINEEATALRLAESLYSRLDTLEQGWTTSISIPGTCPVEWLGHGVIKPWRLPPQAFIRIPDLEPESRYPGRHPLKESQLMMNLSWDGTQVTIRSGEFRDPSAFVRRVMNSQGSNTIVSLYQAGLSTPSKAESKIFDNGPGAPDPGTDETGKKLPVAIKQATTPISSEHNQSLPSHDYPKPVVIEKGGTNGDTAFTAGLLDTAIYRSKCPPCQITGYELTGSPLGSIVIRVSTAQKDPGGAYVTDGNGDLVEAATVLEATLSGAKVAIVNYTAGNEKRITEESQLLYRIVSVTSVKSFTLTMTGDRIVPGFPTGYDTVPKIGAVTS